MKSNPSLYDKIEQYLLGKLPDDENAAMERAIAEQPELVREVELRRLELDTAQELIAQDIRNLFDQLREKEKGGGEKPPAAPGGKRRLWYFLVAAVILAPLCFWLFQWLLSEQPDVKPTGQPPQIEQQVPRTPIPIPPANQDASRQPIAQTPPTTTPPARPRYLALAREQYGSTNWNEIPTAGRNPASGSSSALTQAYAAYQARDYRATLDYLQPVGPADAQYQQAELLRAHAAFQLNRFGQAAESARKLTAGANASALAEEARWLCLLALLAEGKSGTAEFRTLANDLLWDEGNTYHPNAVVLREKLSGQPVYAALVDPANVVPYAALDLYVGSGGRGGGPKVRVDAPSTDAPVVRNAVGEAVVRFAGTVESALTAPTLILRILDNRGRKMPGLAWPLELIAGAAAGTFRFDLEQRINVPLGLYYFTIDQETVFTGRFRVVGE